MTQARHDVVIAGGGIVGATAALALAQAGLDVALVEAQPPGAAAPDTRASSVAYAPFRLWRALGLGPALEAHAQPVRRIVVETAPGFGAAAAPRAAGVLAFDAADLDAQARAAGEPLGWLVENARIRAALAEALAGSGVTVLAHARVAAVAVEPGVAGVRLEDGRKLMAPLVVGAEGRRSAVREAAGIGVSSRAYGQTGISATLHLSKPHGGVARQVFAPGGPLALLPLIPDADRQASGGDRASLVWSAPDAQAQALLAMDAAAFEGLLARRFGEAAGRLTLAGPRRGFPLGLQLADALVGPRTVLAGDAAHAVHPIAGQGLNLGLKDAAALAEVVVDARRLGEDWGAPAVLDRYARWRRFDRAALAAGTDALALGLSAPRGPLRVLGAAALAAAAATPVARRLFAREAGGRDGRHASPVARAGAVTRGARGGRRAYMPCVAAPDHDADLILAGGGLSATLLALRLKRDRPGLRVLLLERGATLGAGHTWSAFESDFAPEALAWVAPLAAHRWPGYAVRFPEHMRRLDTPYLSITDDSLHAAALAALGEGVLTGVEVVGLEREAARLADGRRLTAPAVVDARGPAGTGGLVLGYQKFVGLEVETAAPHGLSEPVIMDATVPQRDGYRFVYLLPFSPTRVLIEDTRYADGPALDHADLLAEARAYAATQGWTIAREVRVEHGVLPVALAGDIAEFWRLAGLGSSVPRIGLRAALFHPTTGYSLPDAARLADRVAALPELTTASIAAAAVALSTELWEARAFYRLLDRMLFRAADGPERYRVLQRFYRLPTPLIRRFYAAQCTGADKLRILSGRPPVPIGRALHCLSETRMIAEAA